MRRIILADNPPCCTLSGRAVDLLYRPAVQHRRAQSRTRLRRSRDEEGETVSDFKDTATAPSSWAQASFADSFADGYLDFLLPRFEHARRILAADGSFSCTSTTGKPTYCKGGLDGIFGRDAFLNEIIWAYDYGGRPSRRWAAKHDTILWYAKDPGRYTFDSEAVDRVPYMAPALVGAEKAARGKIPTDVWWHTIVPTNGRERVATPPKSLSASWNARPGAHRPGDLVMDFFAGSGTLGDAAYRNGRDFVLIDSTRRCRGDVRRLAAPHRR